ncbi:hypothetical protein BaRGS_00033103, partial [Batillaria attramentaria]
MPLSSITPPSEGTTNEHSISIQYALQQTFRQAFSRRLNKPRMRHGRHAVLLHQLATNALADLLGIRSPVKISDCLHCTAFVCRQ